MPTYTIQKDADGHERIEAESMKFDGKVAMFFCGEQLVGLVALKPGWAIVDESVGRLLPPSVIVDI